MKEQATKIKELRRILQTTRIKFATLADVHSRLCDPENATARTVVVRMLEEENLLKGLLESEIKVREGMLEQANS